MLGPSRNLPWYKIKVCRKWNRLWDMWRVTAIAVIVYYINKQFVSMYYSELHFTYIPIEVK